MVTVGQTEEVHIATCEIDDRNYAVAVSIENDGVEHVGHLWFTDEEWDDEGVRDHGAIPGKSPEEVVVHARALSTTDLTLRFRRAQADQRKNHGLRRLTEKVLEDIRYLHKVATSMRAGLLEVEDAAAEIESTETRLHEMIDQMRHFAGLTP